MSEFAGLKPGDEVAVETVWYGERTTAIEKIDKVTPSGRIVIGVDTFDPSGRERGVSGLGHWKTLRPLTAALREKIKDEHERRLLISRLKKVSLTSLPLETLRRMVACLPKEEPR